VEKTGDLLCTFLFASPKNVCKFALDFQRVNAYNKKRLFLLFDAEVSNDRIYTSRRSCKTMGNFNAASSNFMQGRAH
jgi:hypothetical protein